MLYQWTRLRCIWVYSKPLSLYIIMSLASYFQYVLYMEKCWLTVSACVFCNKTCAYRISSRFGSIHMVFILNALLSCELAGSLGCRQVMCEKWVKGVAFLTTTHAHGVWVCDLLSLSVWVSLFLTHVFCVFQEKADTSSGSLQMRSDIQVSRPTMQRISAFKRTHNTINRPPQITICVSNCECV